MAKFIHQNNALQLTFAKITYLRDTSCNINGIAIWEYAAGSHRVKTALYVGWRKNIATLPSFDDGSDCDFEVEREAALPAETLDQQQMSSASFQG
jgi:hypothetical protein